MNAKNLYGKWESLDSKTKMMALGTIALFLASICLSFSNCAGIGHGGKNVSITVEEGVEIPSDAESIPVATHDSQLVTSLTEILCIQNCRWQATDDPLCMMTFTENGFTEYNEDVVQSAQVEFYSIETTENGRAGTWRVIFEDGSIVDASFQFIQNYETGLCTLTSSAFPTYQSFQATIPESALLR